MEGNPRELFEHRSSYVVLAGVWQQALRNLSSVFGDLDKDFSPARRPPGLLEDIVSISSVRSGKLSGRGMSAFLRVLVNLRDDHFPPFPPCGPHGRVGCCPGSVADALTYHSCSEISDAQAALPPADFAANLTTARTDGALFRDSFSVWSRC